MARVSFIVDGKKLEAEEGSLLLPHLLNNGIDVPHFCYHESLGADGNCRMCMVDIVGQKHPQIACDTPIKKDMVVNTKNEKINAVKRNILELELLSHPVDCPICDQAGECKLQDYYMEFGLNESRRPKEEKKLKNKKLDLGRNIMLDQERCVLCARCTRFTQEVTHTNELSIIGRGNDARVSTMPNQKMFTKYAMNVIDLCPVGALTSKDFRFKQRVWFMNTAKGVCHGCAKGCNIYIDHNQQKYQSDTIFRFRPRINRDINGFFICDDGRLSYEAENKNRVDSYLHHARTVSKESAISYLLKFIHDEKPLILISPSLSLEEMYAIKLLSEKFGLFINACHNSYIDADFSDDWLRSDDKASNLNSIKKLNISYSKEDLKNELSKTKVIINFNHKAFEDATDEFKDMLGHKTQIHFISHKFENYKQQELVFPIASYSEHSGSVINEDGILQKYEAGLCNDRQNILELLNEIHICSAKVEDVFKEIKDKGLI